MTSANADVAAPQTVAPTFAELVRVSFRIGCLSFGGPAGQIALMHRMLVDERKWIDEKSYLNALNFCMLLPGPEAMQLATYVGWRLHGVAGGLVSGLLFVLPGAVVMLALSALYAAFGTVPIATALLTGVKAAVLAIVIEALVRIARRGLKTTFDQGLAAIAFVAIFFFAVPFPIIVIAAALIGFLRGRGDPPQGAPAQSVAPMDTVRTVGLWLAIWVLPLLAIAGLFGSGHVLSQIAWFFSKLAMVTFGGAYAVLAYMAQDVVKFYGWLAPGEMVDGLGLAETTPGPLILVTQFVGFLAAFRSGGGSGASAWIMGSLGALVTLWATFAPCFLWIFAGAPYVELINRQPALKSALAAVTAAVVGVVLNLTVWFALNVLFRSVNERWVGPLHLHVPDLSTLEPVALALAALAFVLIMVRHVGIITTLCVCGGLSIVVHLLGGGV
jgi:chromate transporter